MSKLAFDPELYKVVQQLDKERTQASGWPRGNAYCTIRHLFAQKLNANRNWLRRRLGTQYPHRLKGLRATIALKAESSTNRIDGTASS